MYFASLISVISVRDTKNEHEPNTASPVALPDQMDDFFPTQIYDIRSSNKGGFKFRIDFIGLKTRAKQTHWIKSANLTTIDTRNFLLGKFYHNLQEMLSMDEHRSFAEERLKLLQEFAKNEKIDLVDIQACFANNEKNHKRFKQNVKGLLRKSGVGSKSKRIKKVLKESEENMLRKKAIQKASSTNSLKKKIDFIKKNVLKEIKEMQAGLKQVTYLNKKSFFKCLDHLSIHSASLYNDEFKINPVNA